MDGKITYVGGYMGSMFVKTGFPATLPKFCIAVHFMQKEAASGLKLHIFLPGDTDEKASIQADIEEPPQSIGPSEFILIGVNAVFTPLLIEQPGMIKVRILRNGVLHRVGSLNVAPASEAPTSAPLQPS